MSGDPRETAGSGAQPGGGRGAHEASSGAEAGWPDLALWFTPEAVVLMVREAGGAWAERAEAPLDENGQASGVIKLLEAARLADPNTEPRPTVQLWLPEEHVVRLWLDLEEGLDATARLEAAIAAVVAQTEQPADDLALSMSGSATERGARLVIAAFAQTVREAQAYAEGWGFRTAVVTAAPGLDGGDAPAGPPRSLTDVATLRARAAAMPRADRRPVTAAGSSIPRQAAPRTPGIGPLVAAGAILVATAFFLGTEIGPLLEDDPPPLDVAVVEQPQEAPGAAPTAEAGAGAGADRTDGLPPALAEPARPEAPERLGRSTAEDAAPGAAADLAALAPTPQAPRTLRAPARRLLAAPSQTAETVLPRPETAPSLASDAPARVAKPAAPVAPSAVEGDHGTNAPAAVALAPTVPAPTVPAPASPSPSAAAAPSAVVAPAEGLSTAPSAPSGEDGERGTAVAREASIAPRAPDTDRPLPTLPPAAGPDALAALPSVSQPVLERSLPLDTAARSGPELGTVGIGSALPLPTVPALPPLETGRGRSLDLTPTAAAPEEMDRLPVPRPDGSSPSDAETVVAAVPTPDASVPLPPEQPGTGEAAASQEPEAATLGDGELPEEEDGPPSTLAVAAAPTPATRPKDVPPATRGSLVRLGAGSSSTRRDGPRVVRPTPSSPPETISIGLPTSLPARVRRNANEGQLPLGEMTLIGVLELETGRQALLRLPNGRYQRLSVGDEAEGWQITAIGGQSIRLRRQGDERVLALVAR